MCRRRACQTVGLIKSNKGIKCAEGGSRTRTSVAHTSLKRARLPIPPLRLIVNSKVVSFIETQAFFTVAIPANRNQYLIGNSCLPN